MLLIELKKNILRSRRHTYIEGNWMPTEENDLVRQLVRWESLSRYQVAAVAVEALAELERRVADEEHGTQIRSMLGYAKARVVDCRNWWD